MKTVVIEPPRRLNLPRWSELWQAREVVVRLAYRDIIVRYRQTILGVAWVIIQPVMSAGIFSLVFGTVAKLSSDGLPYFLFSLAGMLAWNLFNGALTRASASLVANQALVSKVFFPRILVPISTIASVMLDFVVGLALAIVLLFVYGVNPGWPILLIPVWVVLIAMLGIGIGTAAAAMMVRYRDIGYILPWLLQIILYASPVAYSIQSIPKHLKWIFAANPITWLLDAFRWSLVGTTAPPLWQIISLCVVSVVLLFLGVLYFQSHEREFADMI